MTRATGAADTLTEDFDLSYRAELKGWRFKYIVDVVNPAELPATVSAYTSRSSSAGARARSRPPSNSRRPSSALDLPWKVKLEALTHLTNYLVHPLMVINIHRHAAGALFQLSASATCPTPSSASPRSSSPSAPSARSPCISCRRKCSTTAGSTASRGCPISDHDRYRHRRLKHPRCLAGTHR
jgi:hypothetical protein